MVSIRVIVVVRKLKVIKIVSCSIVMVPNKVVESSFQN